MLNNKQELISTREQLFSEIEKTSAQISSSLKGQAERILEGTLIGNYDINIMAASISFSEKFYIRRRMDWSKTPVEYLAPTLSCSSFSEASPEELLLIIDMGRLASLVREESSVWRTLIQLMDEYEILLKTHLSPLTERAREITNNIQLIEREEKATIINKIIEKGTILFPDHKRFCYGPRRYDYVNSKSYKWFQNPGGKTYKVMYDAEVNSGWDGEKYTEQQIKTLEINKRIKNHDLRAWIEQTYGASN